MTSPVLSPEALAPIVRAGSTAQSGVELFDEIARRLRELVPFDGSAWFATDPSTMLATLPARIENIEEGHCDSYWRREFHVPDALLFRDLARAAAPVDSLAHATDSLPQRSPRYREFLQPQGYGDEIRGAMRVGESTWAVVDLFRDAQRSAFTADDVARVAAAGPAIARAVRDFVTRTSAQAANVGAEGPGTALFDGSGALVSIDEQAERWFEELAGPEWGAAEPPVLMVAVKAAVARASAVASGQERGASTARLRAASGRWLIVHASSLRGRDGSVGLTAVVVQPAKSAQIAPIIVEAYKLTPREREITQAVARGLTNTEIAAQLFLSAHTVRDHLTAVFEKLGVSSRGELVARLFADHYAPTLHAVPLSQLHAVA